MTAYDELVLEFRYSFIESNAAPLQIETQDLHVTFRHTVLSTTCLVLETPPIGRAARNARRAESTFTRHRLLRPDVERFGD